MGSILILQACTLFLLDSLSGTMMSSFSMSRTVGGKYTSRMMMTAMERVYRSFEIGRLLSPEIALSVSTRASASDACCCEASGGWSFVLLNFAFLSFLRCFSTSSFGLSFLFSLWWAIHPPSYCLFHNRERPSAGLLCMQTPFCVSGVLVCGSHCIQSHSACHCTDVMSSYSRCNLIDAFLAERILQGSTNHIMHSLGLKLLGVR